MHCGFDQWLVSLLSWGLLRWGLGDAGVERVEP